MKKLIMTTLVTLACGSTYALPVGNPADASLLCDGIFWEGHCGDPCDPCMSWCNAFSLRIGFYGDYVFDRHMEVNSGEHPDIEKTSLYTNAGLIVANFWDRFDIFATLGATNLFIDTNVSAFDTDGANVGQRVVIDTETDFSWSTGIRGTIWECGCTTFGFEAQYFYTSPKVSRITRAAQFSLYDELSTQYSEWQVGVGIAHRINILTPYIAVKWAHANLELDGGPLPAPLNTLDPKDSDSDKLFGYAVGVSLVDCEKASITVEGRWGDERAVHVNGQLRF